MEKYSYELNEEIELAKYLFHRGENYEIYKFLGAHPSGNGYKFTVWAPNAKNILIVGDFNNWEGYPMERITDNGLWYINIYELSEFSNYKYKIITKDNKELIKSDPIAFYSEVRPDTASITFDIDNYLWKDNDWIEKRKKTKNYDKPMNIYEMNLMSWKKKDDGEPLTYREIANDLVIYLKRMNYTHVEIMPIYEHPFDGSWGYQLTGYFSITSRYGTPADFMYLVDLLHQNDLGVIIDWVPCHFCKDDHGLRTFDGSPTFESNNIDISHNHEWDTLNFDYGKEEVISFLVSSAMMLFDKYHVDGIRVDAVAHMLIRPDGSHNHDAVKLIKTLNTAVFSKFDNILMIAEESTSWPLVTSPVDIGGLGFNFKWNMGWMNDILDFFELEPEYRKYHSNLITFSITYAYSENFILPLSHDEVVHEKKSLLNKMPGDYWQKFANLRLLFVYLMTHPGKKLNFMGSEFGQFIEWNEWQELDWKLSETYEKHGKMMVFTRELNEFYLKNSELFELDTSFDGFQWITHSASEHYVVSYIRKNKLGESLIIVFNFTPETLIHYKMGINEKGTYEEIFNSDLEVYGGVNKVNDHVIETYDEKLHGFEQTVDITIPPLGAVILKKVKEKSGKND